MQSEEKNIPVSFTFKASFESNEGLKSEIENDIGLLNEKIERYRKSIGIKIVTTTSK